MLHAGAKVNLVLEVLGKREDGYHEIATVMQAVDLSDRVVLEPAERLELRTSDPALPTDATNLALRAALVLAKAAGLDRGARITIDKRIPVAAGLGGGSADAAAVLVGLNRLWGLRWPAGRLAEVAVELGMDVPFFLHGGAALGTGRGERLERVGAMSLALVLVNPGFPVSTAEAYGAVSPALYTDGVRAREMARALGARMRARVARSLYNALEAAVAPAHPEIARMTAALVAAGALGAAMSGSGATVFGIARSLEHARQIQARVTRGRWSVWAVRALRGPAVRMRS
ncbi:MAG: 4-(cytidine 5'-diphospho)-2-C-methyl-D-erythritol kinase [Candidatus Rokubacteria bacterium]|nr:4-(cytidine 5'-diphospho)-2-C-methyl-D-erythritol kinase [Candidatus Rokubacteria bacterium]